jgi:pre-mRNA-splicing factor SYF1
MQLCDICAKHPEAVANYLNVETIIRSGIARYSDEVGRLWCRLADYYVRLGQFERARDIYEEAINTVTTVKDFTIIFDAYTKVEESVISTKARMMEPDDDDDEVDEEELKELAADVDMGLERLEYLMDKRPLLLNSVVLRQNPNNVYEWHKRVKLYKDDPQKALMTFVEGVKTVEPKFATGKLSTLWLAFSKFYEKNNDMENARIIMLKATEVNYKNIDELANVWVAWGKMELKHENFDQALSVMRQAVTEPEVSIAKRKEKASRQGRGDVTETHVSDKIHRHLHVWTFYLDLEESLGTVESCRAAYDRAIALRVITAQMTLSYASFLEDNNYFEDSFRVYEQGVTLFTFPQVKKIWLTYLDKFIARYEGTKLERLRDLFEQSVAHVPPEDAPELFIKYAKAEEEYGMARHAMLVYDRATRMVTDASRLDMYRLYIKKVEQYYGVTRTRVIYERAISELRDDMSRTICLEFAEMETKLGEVDRARAIYQHGSQTADPRRDPQYWVKWREFEEAHGNEDTFRDMLRIMRSIEFANSQVSYTAMDALSGNDAATISSAVIGIGALEMEAEQDAIERSKRKMDVIESTAKKIKLISDEININNIDDIDKIIDAAIDG